MGAGDRLGMRNDSSRLGLKINCASTLRSPAPLPVVRSPIPDPLEVSGSACNEDEVGCGAVDELRSARRVLPRRVRRCRRDAHHLSGMLDQPGDVERVKRFSYRHGAADLADQLADRHGLGRIKQEIEDGPLGFGVARPLVGCGHGVWLGGCPGGVPRRSLGAPLPLRATISGAVLSRDTKVPLRGSTGG